ncbi:PTS system mannose/fructose/sorbose family transporter subunit IID [Helcococcus ovis]|uniref:PTS system mannose/fructose/sorbose family transporter subunit IID n=1 Tax=Helcococcus ovis TaxID=72026 RepID=UPI0038B6CFD9
MKNNKILTKKDVSKSAWTWMFFHHCAQNYERMQGLAYCHTLSKPLEKIYKDDKKGLSEALKRNLVFFNTEPQLGSIVPGISLALEEDYYLNGKDGNTDLMTNVKNSLMGPLAGIGDSLLVGTLNPILLSIGIGLSEGGSPLGPLTFLSIVGLIVIGAVASTTIKAPIALQFTSGKMVISLQEIFEKILPKFIPLVLTLVSFYLVKIKKWSTNKLLISIFILSFILVIVGIM